MKPQKEKKGEKKENKDKEDDDELLDFTNLDIEGKCYQFLPLFMRIQKYFTENNVKRFVLFIMRRFGSAH